MIYADRTARTYNINIPSTIPVTSADQIILDVTNLTSGVGAGTGQLSSYFTKTLSGQTLTITCRAGQSGAYSNYYLYITPYVMLEEPQYPDSLVYIGSGTTSVNVTSKLSNYQNLTIDNFIISPISGTSTTGSIIADNRVTVYVNRSTPSYNSSTGVVSFNIYGQAYQGSYHLTTTGSITQEVYYTAVPISEIKSR